MAFQHKRQMNHGVQPTPQDSYQSNPDIASLAALGMRIRKAVADGHATASAGAYSYGSNAYSSPSINRVPLPNGMDEPPSLVNSTGSTIGTSSNLSEWNMAAAASKPVTLPDFSPQKRKLDGDQDNEYSRFRENVDYAQKYGNLSFNEEF